MTESKQEILIRGIPDLTIQVAEPKHIVKCENFLRRMDGIYENNLCLATGTDRVPCGGFSSDCIFPKQFTPRDNYPIEKVAFSFEESSAYSLWPKQDNEV